MAVRTVARDGAKESVVRRSRTIPSVSRASSGSDGRSRSVVARVYDLLARQRRGIAARGPMCDDPDMIRFERDAEVETWPAIPDAPTSWLGEGHLEMIYCIVRSTT